MNTTPKEFAVYLDSFLPKIKDIKNQVCICVPYTHLMLANQKLVSSSVLLGAQNVFYEDSGAYTGEIAPAMLKDLGVSLVIIGHSERRKILGEINEIINKKIIKALAYNLKIVLCIGETKNEKTAGKTKLVLKKQIESALKGLYENELKNVIIAYEPVWSIGTNTVPSSKQVENAVLYIREVIKTDFSEESANKIPILYGGSVNSNNAKQFLKCNGVNGILVGGACLNPDEFGAIVGAL